MKVLYLTMSCCLLLTAAFSQEQFEKRISVSFDHEPLKDVIADLAKTQTEMAYSAGSNEVFQVPITLQLKDVSLDVVMDAVLAQQKHFKDYMISDYGSFRELELFEEKSDTRFFEREKANGHFYHIGDRLPDSVYTIHHYTTPTIRLSSLKKKLIILDMWGIHCSGCIEAIPNMQRLQEKFRDQVQVILVTKDNPQQVERLKKWAKNVRETSLPSITGENKLGSLFDYFFVPKQVWIDESGVVQYITNKEIATEEHIREFLAGKRLPIPEIKDTTMADRYDEPFSVIMQPINEGDFGISSYLAPHKENKYNFNIYAGGSSDQDTLKAVRRQRTDIYELYRTAFQIAEPGFSNTRFIKLFKDPHQYDPDQFWGKNAYDYELMTKRVGIKMRQFYHLMQGQLDAYFNVKSSLQKRTTPCYILSRVKGGQLATRGVEADFAHNEDSIIVQNLPFDYFFENVNGRRQDRLQLVDETGIDGKMKVDCRIDLDFEHHLAAIQQALKKYGLTVTRGERVMDCIVLEGE